MRDFNWLGVGGAALSACLVIGLFVYVVRMARSEFSTPPTRFAFSFPGQVYVQENLGGGIFAHDGPCFGTYGEACSRLIGPYCFIWSTDKLSAKGRAHEIAHCNGWPADHPQ